MCTAGNVSCFVFPMPCVEQAKSVCLQKLRQALAPILVPAMALFSQEGFTYVRRKFLSLCVEVTA